MAFLLLLDQYFIRRLYIYSGPETSIGNADNNYRNAFSSLIKMTLQSEQLSRE